MRMACGSRCSRLVGYPAKITRPPGLSGRVPGGNDGAGSVTPRLLRLPANSTVLPWPQRRQRSRRWQRRQRRRPLLHPLWLLRPPAHNAKQKPVLLLLLLLLLMLLLLLLLPLLPLLPLLLVVVQNVN